MSSVLNALKSELEARERCNAGKTSDPINFTPRFDQHKRRDSNSPFPHLHTMQAVKSVLCNVSFARKITSPSLVVALHNQRLEELY